MNCHNEKLMAQPTNAESSREETLRSSDGVAELEAALRTVKELREARPTRDGTEWAMRAGAQECLEWLVRNERSRCPTVRISDGANVDKPL